MKSLKERADALSLETSGEVYSQKPEEHQQRVAMRAEMLKGLPGVRDAGPAMLSLILNMRDLLAKGDLQNAAEMVDLFCTVFDQRNPELGFFGKAKKPAELKKLH